jgi:hypothetical protein
MKNKVKTEGVIYTPRYIADYMVSHCKPTTDMSIIEPSCGQGVFLFSLLDYMKSTFNLSGVPLLAWFTTKVVGIELTSSVVSELKENLSVYFKTNFNLTIASNTFKNILCQDSLSFSDRKFDLCIGNPPYVRTQNLESDYLLNIRNAYKSCEKGSIDLYFAFIEKYITQANSLCFITPNSFLTNKSGKVLKNLVEPKLSLLIDFKDKKIFTDASVYTCIFKTELTDSTTCLYGHDLLTINDRKKSDIFAINNKVGLITNPLSGIATLCDSVYKVYKKGDIFYASYSNIEYEIEKDIVVPYLKLTKIKANLSNMEYMIYPYVGKQVMSEQDIQSKFPKAYKYFLVVKSKLSQRDKGKGKYEAWYAYGRKQGLYSIIEPEIISIPSLIGGDCKPVKIDISSIQKEFSTFVFTSGFVVPLSEPMLKIGEHILSNSFLEFVKSVGKPWPGKLEPYYCINTKDIKKFVV